MSTLCGSYKTRFILLLAYQETLLIPGEISKLSLAMPSTIRNANLGISLSS